MLLGKNKKISKYLLNKQNSKSITAFDSILSDYLCGELKHKLLGYNLKRISFHIDWLNDYKTIGIQAKFADYFFDIQINTTSFSISYDKDEPDEATEFALVEASTFYKTLNDIICALTQ